MSFSKKEYPPEYLAMIRQFRLIDDTFFAACLDDDIQSMEAILKPILGRDDIKVESVVTQRSAQNLYGRGVRFDVLAYDITHKRILIARSKGRQRELSPCGRGSIRALSTSGNWLKEQIFRTFRRPL